MNKEEIWIYFGRIVAKLFCRKATSIEFNLLTFINVFLRASLNHFIHKYARVGLCAWVRRVAKRVMRVGEKGGGKSSITRLRGKEQVVKG